MKDIRVLVVDDEPNMRRVLEIMLARRGYKTISAADGREAFSLLQSAPVDLVISDLRMPGMNGIELLRKLRESGSDVPLIMITAHGSIESAVEAMRLGACDYLLRPFDTETLDLSISRVFSVRDVIQQKDYLREQIEHAWEGLIGTSAAMQAVRTQIERVAPTRAAVLLTGETGTGKEVVARAIHRASDRRERLFVPVNCAAIPADMLESELFGFEKGAFTGAVRRHIGKFELADGGTLFLDEITEMPVALQAKLLRVLQDGVIERLGGDRALSLDVRIIAASNRSPVQAIREGRLREDVYYRLNVFTIELPPLRARREDIPALVRHFIALHAGARPTRAVPTITPQALDLLQRYDWPGNVRELGNMIERALILSGGRTLEASHFPLDVPPRAPPAASAHAPVQDLRLEPAVEALEKQLLTQALRESGGNKARAAQLLQISERSVWYKLKKYGIGDA
mgnify:CR=1 FL=1